MAISLRGRRVDSGQRREPVGCWHSLRRPHRRRPQPQPQPSPPPSRPPTVSSPAGAVGKGGPKPQEMTAPAAEVTARTEAVRWLAGWAAAGERVPHEACVDVAAGAASATRCRRGSRCDVLACAHAPRWGPHYHKCIGGDSARRGGRAGGGRCGSGDSGSSDSSGSSGRPDAAEVLPVAAEGGFVALGGGQAAPWGRAGWGVQAVET